MGRSTASHLWPPDRRRKGEPFSCTCHLMLGACHHDRPVPPLTFMYTDENGVRREVKK